MAKSKVIYQPESEMEMASAKNTKLSAVVGSGTWRPSRIPLMNAMKSCWSG
jgi:hypothetical protein